MNNRTNGRGTGSQGREHELWPCHACLRDHVATSSGGSGSSTYYGRLRAYCPDLGGYVYSRQALREHRCTEGL